MTSINKSQLQIVVFQSAAYITRSVLKRLIEKLLAVAEMKCHSIQVSSRDSQCRFRDLNQNWKVIDLSRGDAQLI